VSRFGDGGIDGERPDDRRMCGVVPIVETNEPAVTERHIPAQN